MSENKKSILIVAKIALMFFLVIVGIFIVPAFTNNKIQNIYVRENISIYEKDDFNKYLEKLASYNEFYYKREPLVDRMVINQNELYFSFSAYAISYYQENVKNDMILFFIHEAKYKKEPYTGINVQLVFENPIGYQNDIAIYTLNQKTIDSKTLNKVFWAGDTKNTDADVKLNKLSGIYITIKTQSQTKTVVAISSESNDDYTVSLTLEELNLNYENYSLSKNTLNKMDNIPTTQEIETYNLYYSKFDSSLLNQYNWISFLYFGVYSFIVLVVFYFLYIHKEVVNYYKNKKSNNQSH